LAHEARAAARAHFVTPAFLQQKLTEDFRIPELDRERHPRFARESQAVAATAAWARHRAGRSLAAHRRAELALSPGRLRQMVV